MDPLTLLLIAGGLILVTRKKKKKAPPKEENGMLKPGHHEIAVDEEAMLLLPRDTGYWTETGIGGFPGDVDVFSSTGDPLNTSRVRGKVSGPLKIQYYADPEKTDLVGEYSFQVTGARIQPAGLQRN